MSASDNKGAADYSKELSINRAKAVNDYFVAHGVPQTRLTYKEYRLTKPMYSIYAETGRDGNRKTEFKITKINNYNG